MEGKCTKEGLGDAHTVASKPLELIQKPARRVHACAHSIYKTAGGHLQGNAVFHVKCGLPSSARCVPVTPWL